MGGGSSKACSELESESAEIKKAQRRINEMAAPEGPFLVSPRGDRDPTATPPSSPYPSLRAHASSRAALQEDSMEMQSLDDDDSLGEQSMSNDSPTPLDLQSLSAEEDFQYLSTEESKSQLQASAHDAALVSGDDNQAAVVPTEAATPLPQPFAFASAPRPRTIVTKDEPMRVSPVTSPRVSQLSSRDVGEGKRSTTRTAAAARSKTSSRAQTPPSARVSREAEVAADYRTALTAQWDQAEAETSEDVVMDPSPVQRTSPRETQRTLEKFGASAYAEAGSDFGKRSPRAVLPALAGRAAVEFEAKSSASSDTADVEDGVDVHRRRQLRVAAALENMQLEREVSELREQLEREKVVESSRDIWGCNQGMNRMVKEERRPMYGKPLPYLERMHQPPLEARQHHHQIYPPQNTYHRPQFPNREDQQLESKSPRSIGWERREAEAKAAEDQVAQERAAAGRKDAAARAPDAITGFDEVGSTGRGRKATNEARGAPNAAEEVKEAAVPVSVALPLKSAAPLAPLESASSPVPPSAAARQVPARQRRRQRKLQQQQAARQQNAIIHAQRQSQREKVEEEEAKDSVQAQAGGGEELCEKPWSRSMEVRGNEVEYLLRNPVRSTQEMSYALAAAEAGLLFLDHLEAKARELGVLRGTLSRWILPFAEEGQSVEGQRSFAREVMTSLPPAVKQKLSDKEVNYLVKGANSVRRLIRVKIADDNDLNQAKESLLITARFFKRVLGEANDLNIEPYELLKMRRG